MDLNLTIIIVSIVGGFIAGAINTLAGNGSAISLGILTEIIGLPGNLANGTNRIGLFTGQNKQVIYWTVFGALIGVYLATKVSSEQFTIVYKYMMVIMLAAIIAKPSRWLKETDFNHQVPQWLLIPCFITIGIYGGFIQMGMGIFFLAIMVLMARRGIIESNIVKILVVTIYTAIILVIFEYNGLVDWKAGIFLAIGQAAGGYFTTKFALESKKAGLVAYYLLIIIVITVTLRLFIKGF